MVIVTSSSAVFKVLVETNLFHAPLKHAAGVLFWLHDFEFHGCGLDWVEVDDVGCAFHGAITCWVLHFCPFASVSLVVEFPALWNTATAPRSIVEPINGGGADGGCFLEGVAEPFCGVVLWPPVRVRNAAVVTIAWHESVVDGRESWQTARRSFNLAF